MKNFEIGLNNAELFLNAVKQLNTNLDECNIQLDKDGLSVLGRDSAQISMTHLELKKEEFEKYVVNEKTVFGINLDDLLKLLKSSVNKDSYIKLKLNEEKSKLIITITDSLKKVLELPLLELAGCTCKELCLDYDGTAVIYAGKIKDALRQNKNVSDYVTIEVEDNSVRFKSKGDKGNVNVVFGNSVNLLSSKTTNGDVVKCMYSLEYLKDFLKPTDRKAQVTIQIKNDAPLKMSIPLGDYATVTYFLAPRIVY